ncbi:MAG: peptidoglycan DD-metalloendopeptidase family protein [Bacteroidetes bacterium]|nr:peptidoglycan DD-metalloendopeptidase family protein [Bacteroidota bacterium]
MMKFPHTTRQTVHGFILMLILAFLIPPTISSQDTKEKLQKSKKQLEDEIRYTSKLLEETHRTKENSLNKVILLNRQIEKRQTLISTISGELDQIQGQMSLQQQHLSSLSSELRKMKNEYAKMIYYAYKNLNAYNRLLFIFSAEDFNQAYHRLLYYQQYSAYRRTQAELIRDAQMTINRKQRELQETRQEKMTLARSQESEKNQLTQEKDEKDKTVKQLSQKEKELEAALREKQKAAQKLTSEIEKLIAAEIKAAAERAKKTTGHDAKTKMTTTATEIMLTNDEQALSSSFATNKGRLPWPSEHGVITGRFGEHPHPVLKYVKVKNNGIDISTEKGASVRSVFDGKVSRVMSFPNLNKVVIIRHGEYLTVYSNLDEVNVKDGQNVTTRQVIGKIHTNPEDSRTDLHFEIWLGKTIQDPQEWLSGTN